MWSVFLFVRRALLVLLFVAPCFAVEGRASFASLLAGGLSPVGLGGFHSTPARFAETMYGVSFYWMDEVDEISWNLSLDFGNEDYRVGAFVSYASMDSLYRSSYWECSFAKTWIHLAVGLGSALDIQWMPGEALWTRYRFKLGIDYAFRQVYFAGMLSGWADEGPKPIVGIHWFSDESVSAFAEFDFDNLYVGTGFRWQFIDISTSYRFPDFAVALAFSFRWSSYGVSYARGFLHNSLGWNGVHVSRLLKVKEKKIN